MAHSSGNPTWKDYPDQSTPVNAQALENLENTVDGAAAVLAQARNTANQTIVSAGTWTPVALPAEDFDDDGVHSTTTDTGRFTYTRAGIYAVSSLVLWAPNASTSSPARQSRLVKSGTAIPAANATDAYAVASTYMPLVIPTLFVAVASGQYIELQVSTGLAGAALFGSSDSGALLTSRLVRPA